jgi:hypothetical protein
VRISEHRGGYERCSDRSKYNQVETSGVVHTKATTASNLSSDERVDLADHTIVALPNPAGGPFSVSSKFDDTGNIVRVGLNYKFSSH